MTKEQPKTISFEKGYAQLVEEGLRPNPQPRPNPTMLPLVNISFATSVFQPRTKGGNIADSAGHVAVLAMAIRTSANHLLDPVLIWWSGKRWRVIDGHHRLIAYQQVTSDPKRPVAIDAVPVEVFEGTLHEAIEEATRRNSKDKLVMTKTDKLERAWKFTALGSMTNEAIAKVTGISGRTITTMRARLNEMRKQFDTAHGLDAFSGDSLFNPIATTWDDAKRGKDQGANIGAEEWATKIATEWAKRFGKQFGKKLVEHPEIMAEAIAVYSERLPALLFEVLKGYMTHEEINDLDEADEPDEVAA